MIQWIKNIFFKNRDVNTKVSKPAKQEKSKLYRVVENLLDKAHVVEKVDTFDYNIIVHSGRYKIQIQKSKHRKSKDITIDIWSDVSKQHIFWNHTDKDVLKLIDKKIGLFQRFKDMEETYKQEIHGESINRELEINNLTGEKQ